MPTPLQRRISALVLITFTSLTLQPLQAAAQDGLARSRAMGAQTAPRSTDEQYSRHLDDIKTLARDGKGKANKHESTRDTAKALRARYGQLASLEAQVDRDFDATEADLIAKNLPPEILARHRAAAAEYRAKKTEFKQKLKALEDADDSEDEAGRAGNIGALSDWLEQNQKSKTHTPADPGKLPFGAPDGKVRPPKESEQEFHASLFKTKPTHLAGPIPNGFTLPAATLPATPTAADLSATEDIALTPAIRALAASLDHSPVKIYNWVRNNIEYLPTYGSIQGADMTLQTKKGNSFDTASLLIGLLRAANIPARYVYGTIQIPADQAMNWVGGATKPEAAQNLMGQGGIPNIGLISGGTIKYIKLEHVWAEAFVDYVPSRGAVNKVGDTWIPMDASYKQYTYTQGMDIKTAVPLDAQALVTQAQAGATVDPSGWVQNVNGANIQDALTTYQTQVKNYIDTTKPNATVGDVLGTKSIVQKNYSILMGTLPYATIATGGKFAALPGNLRHTISLNLYADAMSKAMGSAMLSYSPSLPSLAGKKVALVYEPATAADQAVITAAADSGQVTLPAYLIRLVPALKIEGVAVARGTAFTMGSEHKFTVGVATPWYSHERDYNITAGDLSVLGINPAGITPEIFSARTTQHDLSKGNDPDFTAEMFNQIILGWWGEKFAFNDIVGSTNQVLSYQLPSHGLAGAPVSINYWFGIPRSASYKSRVLDVKEDRVMAEHTGDNNEIRRKFMLAMGTIGSYLEAGIYDQAFLMKPGYSMSSITALNAANDMGVPIYTIDQDNAAVALAQINTDADIKADIQNAVAAGKRVTAAQRDITVGNFTGMGYIIEDTQTGAAAYMISGGRNGGDAPAGSFIYPMPQPVATPIHNFMLSSTLRDANAGLVAKNGVVMGIMLTAAAPVAGAAAPKNPYALAIMAVITGLIIYSSHAQEIEKRYPPTREILRHYTNAFAVAAIDASKLFLVFPPKPGAKPPTFGSGVYFTYPDPTIVCPVTADQALAVKAKLEMAGTAGSFIEIAITRSGYWDGVITRHVNDSLGDEVVFHLPFLYFGPYAVAIEQNGTACY